LVRGVRALLSPGLLAVDGIEGFFVGVAVLAPLDAVMVTVQSIFEGRVSRLATGLPMGWDDLFPDIFGFKARSQSLWSGESLGPNECDPRFGINARAAKRVFTGRYNVVCEEFER
jgi:hypothetical protein